MESTKLSSSFYKQRFFSLLFTFIGLSLFWLLLANKSNNFFDTIFSHSGFSFLGVIGAIFANATGAGGGVIFIPAFAALQFTNQEAVHTSLLIQCFGMTAGSVMWSLYYFQHRLSQGSVARAGSNDEPPQWLGFLPLIILGALFSIIGFWLSLYLAIPAPVSLHVSFSVFSILLGIIIIVNSKRSTSLRINASPTHIDYIAIAILGLIGGIITSWLSVGVGEILVIYLMLRGFCAKFSIAVGVVVSALTVWSALPLTLSQETQANIEVLLFAGPGAFLGGLIAKRVALYFSVTKLKQFFAMWIIFTGVVMILIAK